MAPYYTYLNNLMKEREKSRSYIINRRSTPGIIQSPSVDETQILNAAAAGEVETVQELLQHAAPGVRERESLNTLLHVAAENDQIEMVSFLLQMISPNVINAVGSTPAHLAAICGHTNVLKLLLNDEEFNPQILNHDYHTYRDLLCEPLFLSVLHGEAGRARELLDLGADPDRHVKGVRELGITTSRQLAETLYNQSVKNTLREVKPIQYPICNESESKGAATQEVIGPLRLKVKPATLRMVGNDIYPMATSPKGHVCIFNYGSFKSRPDLELEVSWTDAQNYANLFGQMGYSTVMHSNLTGQETKEAMMKIRDTMFKNVGCAIFIVSSHSLNNETFLTSDMENLSTKWVLNLFKDSECLQLLNKPKIFIFDYCLGYYKDGENSSTSAVTSHPARVQEPQRNTMSLYSSNGSFTSYNHSKDGSAFCTSLCRTLAKHAHDKEVNELYKLLVLECAKTSHSAVPNLHNIGFTKKFYFTPNHFQ